MKEDFAIFDFNLTTAEIEDIVAIQGGKKRTCPDCFTSECQTCAKALESAGCPLGMKMPVWGRGNKNATECMECVNRHNQVISRACPAGEYMVAKACGA